MKLLLAEDERDLREVLTAYLENFGHTVVPAADGQQALEESRSNPYDVIVLDIMMPVMDGLTALARMRAEGNVTPVLMLTAKGEVDDRIAGLDTGADDYLTKPFAMKELLARLNAMTRRRTVFSSRLLAAGNLELDTEQGTLRAVNSLRLSREETHFLALLLRNREKTWLPEELAARVWPEEAGNGERLVDMYLSFLAGKLEAVGADVALRRDERGGIRLT